MEKYDYSGAIIEYCFKMILNMLQDRNINENDFIVISKNQHYALKTSLSPNSSSSFCSSGFCTSQTKSIPFFLSRYWKTSVPNVSWKIKRFLSFSIKFLAKVFEAFMVCIKELESSNKDFNLINVLMENMKSCIESPQSLFEVIMFLSILTQNGFRH